MFLVRMLDRVFARRERVLAEASAEMEQAEALTREPIRVTSLSDHVVLVGHGRVGGYISSANLPAARCLLVAIPDAFEGGQVVQQARAINPSLMIIARAHSDAEAEHLKKHGATLVVMGEHEIGKAMVDNVTRQTRSRSTVSDGARG